MNDVQSEILAFLKDKEHDLPITEIASSLKIDRHTAAKHLESLHSLGLVDSRTVGKSRMWKLSSSQLVSALKNNSELSDSMKNILSHLDGDITIQDRNNILWASGKEGCRRDLRKRCKDCAVDKTFRTGAATTSIKSWPKKKVRVITQPIKDANNNTVAVVEIIKKA